jgi:hypothetical protein
MLLLTDKEVDMLHEVVQSLMRSSDLSDNYLHIRLLNAIVAGNERTPQMMRPSASEFSEWFESWKNKLSSPEAEDADLVATAAGWDAALEHLGLSVKEPPNESLWIQKLRKELMMSKSTHNFTFSRDEVMELLGGKFEVVAPVQTILRSKSCLS